LRKVIDRAMVSKVYKVLRQKKVETDQQTESALQRIHRKSNRLDS
jgi:RNA polymerase-interacting CarD/CdnL/TRCF family regulator